MNIKTKWRGILLLIGVGLFLALAVVQATAGATQGSQGNRVTKIRVNGRSAYGFLDDSDDPRVLGFLNVSQDQIANTVALDFTYVTYPFSDPDLSLLTQGADVIPNTAFTMTDTSAHLAVTTPPSYQITRCIFDQNTGEMDCDISNDPISFDLTWVTDGFGSITESTDRVEIFGPVTTKYKANLSILTATVNGTWGDEHTAVNSRGELLDNRNKTFIREVTLKTAP